MRIEHVAIYVNELESARDFFVRYLGGHANGGYHNPRTGFRSYFITFDDGARIECMTKPEMDDQEKTLNRTGYAHIAFSVGSKEKKHTKNIPNQNPASAQPPACMNATAATSAR